jgi:hypothetical protein
VASLRALSRRHQLPRGVPKTNPKVGKEKLQELAAAKRVLLASK